jgi:hypothetical protein
MSSSFLRSGTRRRAAALLAGAVWLAGAAAARADALDTALGENAYRILDELYKRNYKNVGVLHFRTQREGKPATFSAGSISSNLATRLETALIVADDPNDPDGGPIGIIRNASATARSRGVGAWYTEEGERRKLFAGPVYPLAWGDRKVSADAFLTGVVHVNKDLDKVSVTIEAFSAEKLEPEKLHEFTVSTDRSLLRDLGQTFMVTRRGLPPAKRDALAIRDARKRDLGEATDDPATPDDTYGMRMRVLYDDVPQDPRKDEANGGEWRVDPPSKGQRIKLVLTHLRKTDKPLAVVLKVNGQSTYKKQEAESKLCQMWVLQPGSKEVFEGFYMSRDMKNLLPFTVLDDEESTGRTAEFGGKAGLFELDVFESRPEEESEPMTISMRSIRQQELRARPPETLAELRRGLARYGNMVTRKPKNGGLSSRPLIVPGKDLENGGPIEIKGFLSPVYVGGVVIRYYDPRQMQISN